MPHPTTAAAWYAAQTEWTGECGRLRTLLLGLDLTETLKWRHPCYCDGDQNVSLVSWRSDGAVVSLLKGALVDDPRGRLRRAGQNRYDRYLCFESLAQLEAEEAYLLDLLRQNLQAVRDRRTLPPLPDEPDLVPELAEALAADPALAEAYAALTPGRKRGYDHHLRQAMRSQTRSDRIARVRDRILAGKGLRDCVCGKTRRPPGCDGSHRSER